ncbi:MAG: putative RNA methyltransferase [Lutispora sp.]|jgi:23S rRNA (guanine745-N1)-methyltransferase
MVAKTLFKCPVCSKPLSKGEKQYFCNKNHSFDIARKGYVNLLLPSHIGSGDPGDSKEMLQSRREFLNKGYYEKFSDQLNNIIVNNISDMYKGSSVSILDAGCGEGYYISRLKNNLTNLDSIENLNIYGIDVSKPAIHYASGRDKDIFFAVASTYHIPILNNSIDYIICIFAPRDEEEFLRILNKEAKLIVAAPGANHLLDLKKAIYGDSELIGQKGTVGKGFKLLYQVNVSYHIHLESTQDILNLLTMTPYIRHTSEAEMEKLKSLDSLKTVVDFNIMVYQKK